MEMNADASAPRIPTAYKDKLGKSFSWPLTATDVSGLCQGLDGTGACYLHFCFSPALWATKPNRGYEPKDEVTVFIMSNAAGGNAVVLTVYAVPSPSRKAIKDALSGALKGAFREWFSEVAEHRDDVVASVDRHSFECHISKMRKQRGVYK